MRALGPSKLINSARIKHQCCWCGQSIEKGESYYRWVYVFECEIETSKSHPECHEAMLEWTSNHNNVDPDCGTYAWDFGTFMRGSIDQK